MKQRSAACGQRAAKAQWVADNGTGADAGRDGGGESVTAAPAAAVAEAKSTWVYGCLPSRHRSAAGASSINMPEYITPMRSQK